MSHIATVAMAMPSKVPSVEIKNVSDNTYIICVIRIHADQIYDILKTHETHQNEISGQLSRQQIRLQGTFQKHVLGILGNRCVYRGHFRSRFWTFQKSIICISFLFVCLHFLEIPYCTCMHDISSLSCSYPRLGRL